MFSYFLALRKRDFLVKSENILTGQMLTLRIFTSKDVNVNDNPPIKLYGRVAHVQYGLFGQVRENENETHQVNKRVVKLLGGMQNRSEQEQYAMEMKALKRLCGNSIEEETLRKQLEENKGNVSLVIEKILIQLMSQNVRITEVQETEPEKKIEQTENKDEL
ncbi:hypothetical protein RFI_15302, partial [Reticulomyxa filosa]